MSKYNWPEIFKAFEDSELSQTQFCKEHNISLKYFNLKYSKHRSKGASESSFVKVDIEAENGPTTLSLQVGRCRIICPEGMPIPSFVALVRQLA